MDAASLSDACNPVASSFAPSWLLDFTCEGLAGLVTYTLADNAEIDLKDVGILALGGSLTGWLGAKATSAFVPSTLSLMMGKPWIRRG